MTPGARTVTAAVVQAGSIPFDADACVDKACRLIGDAAAAGAAVVGDSSDAVLIRGGSAIVSPLGNVLAGPHFDGETILTAALDLDEIGRAKFDFDVCGHYARPDVFQLTVNEAPMAPVVVAGRKR